MAAYEEQSDASVNQVKKRKASVITDFFCKRSALGSHELPTIEDFETVPSPPSSHVTPEAAKSTSHSSQPATTKQVSTPSRSQMELPLRAGTNRRTALSGSEGLN
ncbi:hypothetical protein EMCRGX_G007881 [Ephydatia muelleri]